MRAFNAEYRRRREAALAVGRGFMSYERARARLRAAIAGIIAKGGERVDLAACAGCSIETCNREQENCHPIATRRPKTGWYEPG